MSGIVIAIQDIPVTIMLDQLTHMFKYTTKGF